MKPQHATALAIAFLADLVQIVLWPIMFEGVASPFDDAVDIVVGLVLLRTFGFDLALIPTALIEFMPGTDLLPTWTLTTLHLIRKANRTAPVAAGSLPTGPTDPGPRVVDVKPVR
jgi:hypothetical protein